MPPILEVVCNRITGVQALSTAPVVTTPAGVPVAPSAPPSPPVRDTRLADAANAEEVAGILLEMFREHGIDMTRRHSNSCGGYEALALQISGSKDLEIRLYSAERWVLNIQGVMCTEFRMRNLNRRVAKILGKIKEIAAWKAHVATLGSLVRALREVLGSEFVTYGTSYLHETPKIVGHFNHQTYQVTAELNTNLYTITPRTHGSSGEGDMEGLTAEEVVVKFQNLKTRTNLLVKARLTSRECEFYLAAFRAAVMTTTDVTAAARAATNMVESFRQLTTQVTEHENMELWELMARQVARY